MHRKPALLFCLILAACQPAAGSSGLPPASPGATAQSPAATIAPHPSPTLALPAGRLVFQRSGEGGGVFTINADGTEEQQVLGGTFGTPKWSPDEAHLLVYQESEVAVVPALVRPDGSGYRALTPPAGVNCGGAIWSRDGAHVAAECWVEGDESRTGIYLADIADGSYEQLTTGHAVPAEFSPDGSQLLFVRDLGDAGQALELADADGSHERRLGAFTVGQFAGFMDHGRSIYAASNGAIVVLSLTGDVQRTISAPELKIVEARLSPDERWFAIIYDPQAAVAPGLYRIALDGSGFGPIVHTNVAGVEEGHPDWRPNAS